MTALDEAHGTPLSQTVEFEHHLDHDTPEDVGQELQDEYKLSDTDRTIVTAIITECLSTVTGCASPSASRHGCALEAIATQVCTTKDGWYAYDSERIRTRKTQERCCRRGSGSG